MELNNRKGCGFVSFVLAFLNEMDKFFVLEYTVPEF